MQKLLCWLGKGFSGDIMKKIVLIGGGGHSKVIIDIINSTKEYEIVGLTEKK